MVASGNESSITINKYEPTAQRNKYHEDTSKGMNETVCSYKTKLATR